MSTGRTYLVVPVEKGDGLVCRIGTGREAVTSASAYAALAVVARPTDVMAVWQFNRELNQARAEELALMGMRPTKLLICTSSDYGTLELSHSYVSEVEVIDVRPEV